MCSLYGQLTAPLAFGDKGEGCLSLERGHKRGPPSRTEIKTHSTFVETWDAVMKSPWVTSSRLDGTKSNERPRDRD